MSDKLLVITTLPDQAAAEQLAKRLVEAGLAACGVAICSVVPR